MTLTPPDVQALVDAAAHVEKNRLNSHEWVVSIEAFDLIRLATPPAVLDAVDAVRGMNLSPELAALLRARAGVRV